MMESRKVIRKVTESTEWCSSFVTVKKTEGLRLCLDPQNLNKAIVREWYQLPTFEEIASKMAGAKIFSILDGNKGFYQIKLAEQSQLLTTFNAGSFAFNAGSFARYCYQRVPFGLCSAPEVFHRMFKEIFSGLPGMKYTTDHKWFKEIFSGLPGMKYTTDHK
ncbi:Reverse transcriptase (RNA-dependent DNA polymerase) [Popillia japonica]|uniref:Reverse transcriptase (RNA-dependent DNA polymerase) n=1 Tax=Popillia japonica TaxID=7064 RepID=A0AAW1N1G7_POPJA